METNETIARKWLDAFNAHDTERILVLYHDQAEHYSPKLKMRELQTNGLITGKAQLQSWWLDSFKRLPSLRYELRSLIANNEQVFIEYIRRVDGEDDMTVGEILKIKDGLIVYSRVYHS